MRSRPYASVCALLVVLVALTLSMTPPTLTRGQFQQRIFLPLISQDTAESALLTLEDGPFGFGAQIYSSVLLGDRLIYATGCGQLWAAGPVPGRAEPLFTGEVFPDCPMITALTARRDHALFVVQHAGAPTALWRTDGATAGTIAVYTFPPTTPSEQVRIWSIIPLQGHVIFVVERLGTDQNQFELWLSDGTGAGTTLLKSLAPSPFSPISLGTLGSRFYFTLTDATRQTVLWASDGTAEGTQPVGGLPGAPYERGVAAGRLWFAADDPGGYALWASDGTAEGTRKVRSFGYQAPVQFAELGDIVTFALLPPPCNCPYDLWKSDGTEAGTTLVARVPAYAFPTLMGGRLYFSNQQRLFRSDGSAEGTEDLHATTLGAMVVAGERLFFTNIVSGTSELWLYDGQGARRAAGFADHRTLANLNLIGAGPTTLYVGAREQGGAYTLWAVRTARVP